MTSRRTSRPGASGSRRAGEAVKPASGRAGAASGSPSGRSTAVQRPGSGRVASRPAGTPTPRRSAALTPRANKVLEEPADDQGEEGDAAPAPSYRQRPQGSNVKVYFTITLVLLLIAGAIAYFPIRRSIILGHMDAAKGPAAIEFADEFLTFTDYNSGYVLDAIRTNRGPFEAQLHLAKKCKLFSPGLMTIAQRSNPAPTDEQLATTLATAIEIWDDKLHKNDHMPSELADWALESNSREVSINALHLMEKTGEEETPRVLADVARKPGQDPIRVAAALDSLSGLITAKNLGYALGLLASNACDQVVQHERLRERIIAVSGPDHLKRLLDLLNGNQNPAARALVLEAMGGPAMRMPDGADSTARREEIGKTIASKIDPALDPVECAAAMKAAAHLRLYGARDAVLKMVPTALAEGGKYPGVDKGFLADCLGKQFIFKEPDEARAASEDLIVSLTHALDDEASRSVAATALSHIVEPTFLRLRLALDKLAALGEDPDCYAALKSIVVRTYNRPDVVKANGDDLAKWTSFLAEDRPRYERYVELVAWYAENKQYQRVQDGKKRLGANKDYIFTATEQLNAWLGDEKFVAPLGLTKGDFEKMTKQFNELGMSVRKSWAGALE